VGLVVYLRQVINNDASVWGTQYIGMFPPATYDMATIYWQDLGVNNTIMDKPTSIHAVRGRRVVTVGPYGCDYSTLERAIYWTHSLASSEATRVAILVYGNTVETAALNAYAYQDVEFIGGAYVTSTYDGAAVNVTTGNFTWRNAKIIATGARTATTQVVYVRDSALATGRFVNCQFINEANGAFLLHGGLSYQVGFAHSSSASSKVRLTEALVRRDSTSTIRRVGLSFKTASLSVLTGLGSI